MHDKQCWLLYEDGDLAMNRDFAALMRDRGTRHGLQIEVVTLRELSLGMDGAGAAYCLRSGQPDMPEAVLSRQRIYGVSRHFELMGVPVFNGAEVCRLCNDKRRTHQFLCGLPMAPTRFVPAWQSEPDPNAQYPLILKPAHGHGGDRVTPVGDRGEWVWAAARIQPEPMLEQSIVSGAGRDLRVYVLFGEIVAGVMRTAQSGVVSNFKLGGRAAPHELTQEERALATAVIERFDRAGAPLAFAGVDLLYEGDQPVVGEVEDVVGSRMLYEVSDIDIADRYLAGIAERLDG